MFKKLFFGSTNKKLQGYQFTVNNPKMGQNEVPKLK
jgi:hypothetical protein